jgi:hypothetical protein
VYLGDKPVGPQVLTLTWRCQQVVSLLLCLKKRKIKKQEKMTVFDWLIVVIGPCDEI